MKDKKIKIFNFNLTFSDLFFLYQQISSKKSFLRSTHNLFLKKNINIKGSIADLGSGNNYEYHKYIKDKKVKVDRFDFHKVDKESFRVNLEKKFTFKKKYECILIFNVMEHILNNENLINSISKNLKKKGKLEIFVPFMFRFHSDPNDFFRPTHTYLINLLEKNGFKVQTNLIAVGPMSVILEILFKYLKLDILKFFVSILFILLNKFFNLFSKDFKNYYCGVHCSCIKIK